MNGEQNALLKILGGFLTGAAYLPEGETDWEALLETAKAHQIAGIVFDQCADVIPEALLPKFEKAYLKGLSDYTNKERVLKRIDAAFTENGIPYLLFKGMETAALYPFPALRTMGDIDILVHEEDKERAADLMTGLGLTPANNREDMEWCFVKNGMEFELHHRLLYDETANSDPAKELCDRAWEYASPAGDGSARYVLDPSYHYVFTLLHLKKHILNQGAGLRQFADAAVWERNGRTDPEKVTLMLQKTGADRFAAVVSELCRRWFTGEKDETVFSDDFYEKATATILANGVFGEQNAENAGNHMLNNVRTKGKFLTFLEQLFPSYQDFYYVPHYSFIQGRPYLLPAAWIYRFYRAIRYRKLGESGKLLAGIAGSGEKMTEREKILKVWGI